jgi:hypothetical protein
MADHVDELVAWTLRMSRADREAEPIHVNRTSVGLGAIGFLSISVGEFMLFFAPVSEGGRLAFILLTLGTLFLAAAILSHLDQHRMRFGLPALVFINLGIIAASALWIPYVIDPSLQGGSMAQYAFICWGTAWTLGAIGTFFVIHRKETRLERGGKAATQIHASFFQLLTLGVGMLIYGICFIEQSSARNNTVDGVLSVVGPVLIAIAVINHVEHLTLRIGRPAVILTIIGVSIWSVSNLPRAVTDWMNEPAIRNFFTYGVQGIVFALGAVACLLVLSHKKAWLASRSDSTRLE